MGFALQSQYAETPADFFGDAAAAGVLVGRHEAQERWTTVYVVLERTGLGTIIVYNSNEVWLGTS
jgi:hypothetical protein